MMGRWVETAPEDFEVGDLMDYGIPSLPLDNCFRVVRFIGGRVVTVDHPQGGGEYAWPPGKQLYKWVEEEKPKMTGRWVETKPEDFEVGDVMAWSEPHVDTPSRSKDTAYKVLGWSADGRVRTEDIEAPHSEYRWHLNGRFHKWVEEEKPKMKKIEKDGFYDIWEGQKYIGRDYEKAGVEYGDELTYVLVGDDELPAPPAVMLDDGFYLCGDKDGDGEFMFLKGGKWYECNIWNPKEGAQEPGRYHPYTPIKRVTFEDV